MKPGPVTRPTRESHDEAATRAMPIETRHETPINAPNRTDLDLDTIRRTAGIYVKRP